MMDIKTLHVLEYAKVLERLAVHCDFSASLELARQLEPTTSLELAAKWLTDTSEARRLLSTQDLTIGGAHDVRPQVINAARGGRLEARELLDIQNTLVATRNLRRTLEKQSNEFPNLGELALSLPIPPVLVEAI